MEEMEDRKWENLEMDCLVNIFGRLGLEDKILGVPFVCNSWYKASTDPLCWKILNFEELNLRWRPGGRSPFIIRFKREYNVQSFSITGFLKFMVNRSRRCCEQLMLPSEELTEEDMVYVSDECPAVKVLSFHQWDHGGYKFQPELIRKWTNLEILCVNELLQPGIIEILSEINNHCKNFYGLKAQVWFDDETASAFATYLQKIKYLNLSSQDDFRSSLSKENLMVILEGCKDLEVLHLKDIMGFDVDEEILNRASHIKDFNCEGAHLNDVFSQPMTNCEGAQPIGRFGALVLEDGFFDEVHAELNQAVTDDDDCF